MQSKNFAAMGPWGGPPGHPSDVWSPSRLLERTRLKRFVLLSLGVHILALLLQGLSPATTGSEKAPPPIKVKYFEAQKPEFDPLEGTIIDAPKPEKIEKPKTSKLLSSFDSRAHSNKKKTAKKEYRRQKTVVPKAGGIPGAKKNSLSRPLKRSEKAASKLPSEPKKMLLPIRETGKEKLRTEEKETESAASQTAGARGTLSLLDGFDAEKYASIDTNAESLEFDDEESVSLDTTETKYASYFARIKHQIERVWIYPSDAAQKGISGQLTLKFRISKDGNLLGILLIDSSNHEILDIAAEKAVKEAAPFYPFPITIKKEKLSILATFIYSPTYGLMQKKF